MSTGLPRPGLARSANIYPLTNFVHGALNGLNLFEVSQCSLCNWLFRLFSRHISRTQSFQQNRHIIFSCPCSTEAVGIAHKPPRIL